MKLVKGKTGSKFVISQKEWQEIGKKKGWLKKATKKRLFAAEE